MIRDILNIFKCCKKTKEEDENSDNENINSTKNKKINKTAKNEIYDNIDIEENIEVQNLINSGEET